MSIINNVKVLTIFLITILYSSSVSLSAILADTESIEEYRGAEIIVEYMHKPLPKRQLKGWVQYLNKKGANEHELDAHVQKNTTGERSLLIFKVIDNEDWPCAILRIEGNMILIEDNRHQFLIKRDVFIKYINREIDINWEKWQKKLIKIDREAG